MCREKLIFLITYHKMLGVPTPIPDEPKKIKETARKLKRPYLALSYEDLCLDTENTLSVVSEFLGFQISKDRMYASGTHNHNVFGNRLRHDPQTRTKLQYDYRWFDGSDWFWPSLCLPHVMEYNRIRAHQ